MRIGRRVEESQGPKQRKSGKSGCSGLPDVHAQEKSLRIERAMMSR